MPDPIDRIHLSGRVLFTAGIAHIDLWDTIECARIVFGDDTDDLVLDEGSTADLREWAEDQRRIQEAEDVRQKQALKLMPRAPVKRPARTRR